MRVLVTGATGFIGRQVLAALSGGPHEVHAVSRGRPPAGLAANAWHAVDLLEPGAPARLITAAQPEAILHAAWYAAHGRFWTARENLRWVDVSLDLAGRFAESGGRRFVGVGTCAEYDWSYGYCSESTTPLRPATLYGACKDATRSVLERLCAGAGVSFAWGRIYHLHGPGEPEGRLVRAVIEALVAGQPARCSHGRQVRDFLHVADVASALVAILEAPVVGPVNVGSGEPATIRSIVEMLAELVGRRDLPVFGAVQAAAGDPPVLVPDVHRLRSEVGWAPRFTLREGLRATLAAYAGGSGAAAGSEGGA